MSLVLLTFLVLGLIMSLMAVGVIFGNRALRGSCGGVAVRDPDGEPISCGADCACVGPEEQPDGAEA